MCTKSLLYGYPYLVAVSECCIRERVVRVSLNLDDAIVKDQLIGNTQDIYSSQKLRTANLKDCKNLTYFRRAQLHANAVG